MPSLFMATRYLHLIVAFASCVVYSPVTDVHNANTWLMRRSHMISPTSLCYQQLTVGNIKQLATCSGVQDTGGHFWGAFKVRQPCQPIVMCLFYELWTL